MAEAMRVWGQRVHGKFFSSFCWEPTAALKRNKPFKFKKNVILSNKKILIFDDVYTTGSTVNECSKVIRSLGCNHIDVITIAKDW